MKINKFIWISIVALGLTSCGNENATELSKSDFRSRFDYEIEEEDDEGNTNVTSHSDSIDLTFNDIDGDVELRRYVSITYQVPPITSYLISLFNFSFVATGGDWDFTITVTVYNYDGSTKSNQLVNTYQSKGLKTKTSYEVFRDYLEYDIDYRTAYIEFTLQSNNSFTDYTWGIDEIHLIGFYDY